MACIADIPTADAAAAEDDEEADDETAGQVDIYSLAVILAAGDDIPGSPSRSEPEMLKSNSKRKSSAITRLIGKGKPRFEGQSMPLGDLIGTGQRPVLLLLLRQFGCMLCRRCVGHVIKIYPRLEELGIRVIAVGTGQPEAALKFAQETNFPGRIVTDPSRALYRAFNCKRGLRLCMGKRTLAAAKMARAEGYSQGAAAGDLYQLGGVFLLSRDDGILFQHISMFAGDSADLREMLTAAESHVLQHTEFDPWSNIYALRLERRMMRQSIQRTMSVVALDSSAATSVSANDISAVQSLDSRHSHMVRESVVGFEAITGRIMAAALRDPELAPFDALLRDALSTTNDVNAALQVFVDVQRDRKASWIADPIVIVVEDPNGARVAGSLGSSGERPSLRGRSNSALKLTTAGVVEEEEAAKRSSGTDLNTVMDVPQSPAIAFSTADDEAGATNDGVRVLLFTPQRTVCLRVARAHASGGMRAILSRAKLSLLEVPEWIGMRGVGPDDVGKPPLASLEYLNVVGRVCARMSAPAIKQLEQRAEDALATLGSGKGGFAVGVLYVGRGQGSDPAAVWHNTVGSAAFQSLLDLLGDEIDLVGYKGFAHGLDTRNGLSGAKTHATKFDGREVVFHVSTMIPIESDDGTMMRSMTIAKDAVVIVFVERDAGLLDVSALRTENNQVIVVVRQAENTDLWEIEVVRDDGVPPLLSAAVELAGDAVKQAVSRMVSAVNGEEVRADNAATLSRKSSLTTAQLTSSSFGLTSAVLRPLLLTLCITGESAVLRFGRKTRHLLERDRRWLLDEMIAKWKVGETMQLTAQAKLQEIVNTANAALDASALVPGQSKAAAAAAASASAAATSGAGSAAYVSIPLTATGTIGGGGSRAELSRTRSELPATASNGAPSLQRTATASMTLSSSTSSTRKGKYIKAPAPALTMAPSSVGDESEPPAAPDAASSAGSQAVQDISEMVDINYEELVPGEQLGRGYFGEVRAATWSGTPVACKVLYRESFLEQGQLEMFVREAMLLSKLKHPHIVQYLGVSLVDNSISRNAVLVTELMRGGSLLRRIYSPEFVVSLSFARDIAQQVGRGMVYLHQKKLIHRDLSSNNILLDNTAETRAKIADFGLSIEQSQMSRVTAGPLLWMAPEVFRGQQFTKAIDSFSFGVVMYEVLTAQPPHFAAGMELEPYARAVALRGYRAPLPDSVPPAWGSLVTRCWAQSPADRPAFDDVLVFAENVDATTNDNSAAVASSRTSSASSVVASTAAAPAAAPSATTRTTAAAPAPANAEDRSSRRTSGGMASLLVADDEESSSDDGDISPYRVIDRQASATALDGGAVPYDHVPSLPGTMTSGDSLSALAQLQVSAYQQGPPPQ